MPSEKRRDNRVDVVRRMQVRYVDDQGRERYEVVSVRDLSGSGCRAVLSFRCQPRTVVAVGLTPVLTGSATVRYQNSTPRGFVTGLEFLGGLAVPESLLHA